jgi:hypothetical protein
MLNTSDQVYGRDAQSRTVIPAKDGIQDSSIILWTPAFAGVTACGGEIPGESLDLAGLGPSRP